MPLSKLMPILMLLGIGAHSKDALTARLAMVLDLQYMLVTQLDMQTIKHQIVLASVGEENFQIQDLRIFISQNLEKNPDRDVTVDAWGTPYRHDIRSGVLTLASAGGDRAFGTKDDIELSSPLSANSY